MLILVSESGRRCDERCYDAKHINCNCICGGANHGKGLAHALQNAGIIAERMNMADTSSDLDDPIDGENEEESIEDELEEDEEDDEDPVHDGFDEDGFDET